jgi:Zn-dependent M28 family amino/carboxypeptidase
VLLEGAPLSQTVIDGLSQAAATYTQLRIETSLQPFASDHVPFIHAGLPAVLTIEGADNANGNIHSSTDTIDRINYDLALEILRMNVAFIATAVGNQEELRSSV